MPRLHLASLGLALLGLAVLACNKREESSIGSPSGSAAGSENAGSTSGRDSGDPSGAIALTRSLVTVASVPPTDAQPCERTCGRVGDCLLETHDVDDFEASRLELECLDACVHSPADAEPRTSFLACEQKSSCGDLLGCARTSWNSLMASRVGPVVSGVTTGGDKCIEGCRWMYWCIFTSSPPGSTYLDPAYEEIIRGCEAGCQTYQPAERAQYEYWSECMPSHCSQEQYTACLNYNY